MASSPGDNKPLRYINVPNNVLFYFVTNFWSHSISENYFWYLIGFNGFSNIGMNTILIHIGCVDQTVQHDMYFHELIVLLAAILNV